MAEAKRPLPGLFELDTQPFWQATKDHELRYQQCDDCDTVVFYPRRHCTGCLGSSLTWKTSAGQGTVYTYSIVRQAYHPFFRSRVPYAIAWIDLDEGPRLLSNVVGIEDPINDLAIGQRVKVTWEDHDELAIRLFEPVD
jgi:uncharacterized OB-fold protein